MDGDGVLDLVGVGSGLVRVWRGNGGSSWTQIGSFNVPAPGTYSGMAIADVDRNGRPDIALVASEQVGTFSTRNKLRLFMETSAGPGTTIGLQSPPAFRVLRAGSTGFVSWRSSVAPGVSSSVDVEISLAGQGGPWLPLAMGVGNTGRAQVWLNPAWSSINAWVRASVFTPAGNASDSIGPLTIVSEACYPDCNNDGALDIQDFGCFTNAFINADPYADCNADGVLDVQDFGCFVNRFITGCP
jgi:hypothetical protein